MLNVSLQSFKGPVYDYHHFFWSSTAPVDESCILRCCRHLSMTRIFVLSLTYSSTTCLFSSSVSSSTSLSTTRVFSLFLLSSTPSSTTHVFSCCRPFCRNISCFSCCRHSCRHIIVFVVVGSLIDDFWSFGLVDTSVDDS